MTDHFGRNFVGGDWVSSHNGRRSDIHDPSCGDVIAAVPVSSPDDVSRAGKVARGARDGWSARSARDRRDLVLDAVALMQRDLAAIAALEARDTGTPVRYLGAHIAATLDEVRTLLLAAPREVSRPPGVVGVVLSWSGPFALACREILPALAAGDVFVIKPSLRAPLSAVLLAERLAEAGLPGGVLNVVQGSGIDAGAPLVRQPGLTEVWFQGSRETAGIVGHAAVSVGAGLRVCLRRPDLTIVDAGADIAAAAEHLVKAALFNTGKAGRGTQVAHIQTDLFRSTMDLMEEAFNDVRYGAPSHDGTSAGPMISERFRQARRNALDLLDSHDITPLYLGPRPDERVERLGWFARPYILLAFKFDHAAHAELPLGPTILTQSLPVRRDLIRRGLEQPGWNTTAVFDGSGLAAREIYGGRFGAP